jgi:hypothetical protein
VIDLGRSCSRYRPLLVDFVDRGEVGPETGAALAHLDRCGRCTEAIESTMLTITALRRLSDEAGALEPSAEAWPRLRLRITRWRRRSAIMSPVAGLAVSVAMVAVLVLPFRLTATTSVDSSTRFEPPRPALLSGASASTISVAVAPSARRFAEAAGPSDPVRTEIRSTPRVSPDGAPYVQKEVPSAPSTRPWTRPR